MSVRTVVPRGARDAPAPPSLRVVSGLARYYADPVCGTSGTRGTGGTARRLASRVVPVGACKLALHRLVRAVKPSGAHRARGRTARGISPVRALVEFCGCRVGAVVSLRAGGAFASEAHGIRAGFAGGVTRGGGAGGTSGARGAARR